MPREMRGEKYLDKLVEAEDLLKEISLSDLRTNIQWLSHTRHALGSLQLAISALIREIRKETKKRIGE